MAEPSFLFALAIGTQATLGTADPTIAALSGALTQANGLVLGDPESGIGGSGFEARFIRELREKARVSGSFTRQASDFLGRKIEDFSVAVPMRGSGVTVPGAPADGDAALLAGQNALLRTTGWGAAAAWAGGVGQVYKPASCQLTTAKLWIQKSATQSIAVVVRDIVGDFELEAPPGSIGIYTASLSGVIDSIAIVTTPTFSYGTLGSVSSPVVENTAHRWGIGGALRGFSEFVLSGSNELEAVPDSNAPAGKRTRQTDRLIEFEATVYADDGDLDFELAQLELTSAPTDELYFTVGSPMTNGQPALAWRLRLPTPEASEAQPAKLGDSGAWAVKGRAISDTADSEAELIFL